MLEAEMEGLKSLPLNRVLLDSILRKVSFIDSKEERASCFAKIALIFLEHGLYECFDYLELALKTSFVNDVGHGVVRKCFQKYGSPDSQNQLTGILLDIKQNHSAPSAMFESSDPGLNEPPGTLRPKQQTSVVELPRTNTTSVKIEPEVVSQAHFTSSPNDGTRSRASVLVPIEINFDLNDSPPPVEGPKLKEILLDFNADAIPKSKNDSDGLAGGMSSKILVEPKNPVEISLEEPPVDQWVPPTKNQTEGTVSGIRMPVDLTAQPSLVSQSKLSPSEPAEMPVELDFGGDFLNGFSVAGKKVEDSQILIKPDDEPKTPGLTFAVLVRESGISDEYLEYSASFQESLEGMVVFLYFLYVSEKISHSKLQKASQILKNRIHQDSDTKAYNRFVEILASRLE